MKIYTSSADISEIKCVGDIFRIMPPDPPFHPLKYMYRGQGNFDWELVPGLFRVNPFKEADGQTWEGVEMHLLQAFMREASPYLDHFIDTPFRRRMLAQHYGVPTRLLDWTLNPLVALYFAVSNLELATDAAFYIAQAANGLTGGVDSTPEQHINSYDFTQLVPTEFDSRIIAQRALFTTHRIPEKQKSFIPPQDNKNNGARIFKFKIPVHDKSRIKLELEQVGIDHARIFPGLDGIGANLRWMFERQKHWRQYISVWSPN